MREILKEPVRLVNSADEWRQEMRKFANSPRPSFFHLRAQLPKIGRTNQVFGATDVMNVVLKTYASGGENEIHAHPNEDHLFVVLQGAATFFGPHDEAQTVEKLDCVLLPAGSMYRFQADEAEPLVLLRVGAAISPGADVLARIGIDGRDFDGYSENNNESPRESRRLFG